MSDMNLITDRHKHHLSSREFIQRVNKRGIEIIRTITDEVRSAAAASLRDKNKTKI